MTQRVTCDLEHARAVPAAVRLEIKSTRVGKPGHPKVRVAALCAGHARELRKLGLELVQV